jgi:hypothetical protein
VIEPELAVGRRAFPKAQELFAGTVVERIPGFVSVGWYGSSRHPETGAFALVAIDGPMADRVGDILKIAAPSGANVFVWVVGARDVSTPLAVTRRAFMGLANLARSPVDCIVGVVG